MPDQNGWPTATEVFAQPSVSGQDGATTAILDDISGIIASVVAEFQSPAGYDGSGGTGRSFTPVTETRNFDGNGYAELVVGDISTVAPVSVAVWGCPLTSVTVKPGYAGEPTNTLAFRGFNWISGYGFQTLFPLGIQNVAVTATWGCSPVPADIYQAILGEATYRTLVRHFVPLSGIGETVSIGDFSINTSAGVSVWQKSSPIAVYHEIYLNCVKRYRVGNAPKLKQLAASRRMS